MPANARIVSARRCAGERDEVRSKRSSLSDRSFKLSTAEMAAKLLLPNTYFFEATGLSLARPLILSFYQFKLKEAQGMQRGTWTSVTRNPVVTGHQDLAVQGTIERSATQHVQQSGIAKVTSIS